MFLSSLENFNYDRTEVSQMTEESVTFTSSKKSVIFRLFTMFLMKCDNKISYYNA